MRGKGNRRPPKRVAAGITPAYAGKSLFSPYSKAYSKGSPPRMRGKASLRQGQRYRTGITPAYAGKRHWLALTTLCRQDHPRVCGEKVVALGAVLFSKGSPPRMRGKEKSILGFTSLHGITPAYAGKSVFIQWPGVLPQDHPRVCGEKHPDPGVWQGRKGSPPRMRGKDCGANRQSSQRGITPAYAGKSLREAGRIC